MTAQVPIGEQVTLKDQVELMNTVDLWAWAADWSPRNKEILQAVRATLSRLAEPQGDDAGLVEQLKAELDQALGVMEDARAEATAAIAALAAKDANLARVRAERDGAVRTASMALRQAERLERELREARAALTPDSASEREGA